MKSIYSSKPVTFNVQGSAMWCPCVHLDFTWATTNHFIGELPSIRTCTCNYRSKKMVFTCPYTYTCTYVHRYVHVYVPNNTKCTLKAQPLWNS